MSGVTFFGRNPRVSAAVRSVEGLATQRGQVVAAQKERNRTRCHPANEEDDDGEGDDDVDELSHGTQRLKCGRMLGYDFQI